jgi:adenylate cyclase
MDCNNEINKPVNGNKIVSTINSISIADILPKYVCHRCTDKVLEYNRKGTFGGEILSMTVMFINIYGFSNIAEKLGPVEAMKVLNANYNEIIETIFQYNGAILKFIGDVIMVAFGLPNPLKDDAERSLYCAAKLQKKIGDFQLKQDEKVRIQIGIGIHCGDVVLGNVGNEKRLDFTIIGDTVNAAARLVDMTRSNEILISDKILSGLPSNKFKTIFVEDFIPKGKTEKLCYYRVKWS